MTDAERPSAGEYDEYFDRYIRKAPYDHAVSGLREQGQDCLEACRVISEESSLRPPARGTWSRREVLGHLVDVERLFLGWVLRIARGQTVWIPGFEPDEFVRLGSHDERLWSEHVGDFQAVRQATLSLFGSLPSEAWERRGEMGEGHHFTVRAIAFIIQGHVAHHFENLSS